MPKVIEFRVGMTCNGCVNAVTRVLGKVPGVEKVEPDLEKKYVKVTGSDDTNTDDCVAALKKWSAASGKVVELLA